MFAVARGSAYLQAPGNAGALHGVDKGFLLPRVIKSGGWKVRAARLLCQVYHPPARGLEHPQRRSGAAGLQGSGVKTAEAYRPDGLAGLVPLSDAGESPPKKPRRKDTGREGVGFTACTETGPQSWVFSTSML